MTGTKIHQTTSHECALTSTVSPGTVRKFLYEKYATTHAGLKSRSSEAALFAHDILPNLPADRDAQIVDLGCGQGEVVHQLLEHGYANACGVDASPEQVQLAHRRGITPILCGDILAFLGSKMDAFAFVIATDVLEHMSKPEAIEALHRMHGALAPGGVLLIRTPNGASPLGATYFYADYTHETLFSPRAFRQVALAVGFEDVQTVPCPPVVHGLKSITRAVLWPGVNAVIKGALMVATGQTQAIITANFVGLARKSAAR